MQMEIKGAFSRTVKPMNAVFLFLCKVIISHLHDNVLYATELQ